MQPRSSSTNVLIVILIIITFPLWIGILAGLFGIVVGLAGGIFGIVAGIFGAIFGIIGGIFGWVFSFPFGGDYFHFNGKLFVIALILIILFLAVRKKKRV